MANLKIFAQLLSENTFNFNKSVGISKEGSRAIRCFLTDIPITSMKVATPTEYAQADLSILALYDLI